MRPNNNTAQDIPLGMVGGNKFGRYNKISDEKSYNMIVSDDWLVPYAGYKAVKKLLTSGKGRGIFSSIKNNVMIVIVDQYIYRISANLNVARLTTTLSSFSGDTSIQENNANQILISDYSKLYLLDLTTNIVTVPNINFIPGFITFQNGRFISPDTQNNTWRLSNLNDGSTWPNDAQHTGQLQTKADKVQCCLRVPAKGNLLFVFGKIVTEIWNDTGAALFPYQRNTSANLDYGCLNVDTIAATDQIVAWLGFNEQSGAVIMVSDGAQTTRLSNDGIDFRLADLNHPELSFGFFFKQDGHIFYQITFYSPSDNFSLIYDFNTKTFFYVTDENMNYHIAKRVAYFNNTYYFISQNDGNLYEMSTLFTTYDYNDPDFNAVYDPLMNMEIPRVRVCPSVRLKNTSYFVSNSLSFPMEQGNDPYFPGSLLSIIASQDGTPITSEGSDQSYYLEIGSERVVDPYVPRVDLSISRDGGESFSNYQKKELKPLGNRKNRVVFWGQGASNELIYQFRFWGKFRFVVGEGVASIYQ